MAFWGNSYGPDELKAMRQAFAIVVKSDPIIGYMDEKELARIIMTAADDGVTDPVVLSHRALVAIEALRRHMSPNKSVGR